MSRPHDAQRTSLPFGNPFRMILPKGSYLSPKLLSLLNSFEVTLADSLRKLKPDDTSDVLSLSWMRAAMESLYQTHANIKTLITALQLPVSDWDEKWVDMQLDNSVKLLDICIALMSELSRLDQCQLLLKYVLHILAFSNNSSSFKQLDQARTSLHDWIQQFNARSPKLDDCSAILDGLVDTLHLVKVKNSAKGKVLMRALYSVKVETVFVCSIFIAAFSGSSKPMKDLNVSGDFLWLEALNDLQVAVNSEFRRQFSHGTSVVLKEMVAVSTSVERLHALSVASKCKQEETEQKCIDTDSEEVLLMGKTSVKEVGEELKESASDLSKSAERLAQELDLLSGQLGDFFQVVLTGRDTLLSNLGVSDVKLKGNALESK